VDRLELRGLSVFRGQEAILTGIDLSLDRGESVLIQGPSGSGKSTLLRAILGFVRGAKGRVLLDGRELDAKGITEFRSHFAYIGQDPALFEGQVRDYLGLPFGFRANKSRRPSQERVSELIAWLGFGPKVLDQEYRRLSGGERQRLTIAQALLLEREVYLLDEVTSSLDEENSSKVIDIFVRDPERTVLVVAHDWQWRDRVDRVLWLSSGRIQQRGARS
jgi:putative ABC transport system ATP-binding protein